jgi:uncharacterized protein with ATP-grasp and redox domains
MTSEPGSFAHNTLAVRVPAILRDTIAANDFSPQIVGALEELHAELLAGHIRPLQEDTPDREYWNHISAPYIGRTWLDAPWYWAEAYFYRRVLEATGYFRPGPTEGLDPYAATKRREWAVDAAPAAVDRLLAALPGDDDELGAIELRFEALLHASLWGNRTDLSYTIAAHLGATGGPGAERDNLLVDDWAAVYEHLREGAGRIAILADNAGTELLMDVALIDFLLTNQLAHEVRLHLKPWPFFVSDAMIPDLADGVDALMARGGAAAQLARRVDGHIVAGELLPLAHWSSASPLFYFDMPGDLYAELAQMDLVIVKGDANYRRLLGDAHWPHETPFADVVSYFPAPLVALRTFKSEVAVGLAPGRAAELARGDPQWLVNGRRGVIQAHLGR